jgi:hypothetical protein
MPKLKPGAKPMRRVTLCISEKDWAGVRFIAYGYGWTTSSVARWAIRDYVAANYDGASKMALSLFEEGMGE